MLVVVVVVVVVSGLVDVHMVLALVVLVVMAVAMAVVVAVVKVVPGVVLTDVSGAVVRVSSGQSPDGPNCPTSQLDGIALARSAALYWKGAFWQIKLPGFNRSV